MTLTQDILSYLAKVDFKRIAELANTVWEDRDKIGESIDLVYDNREKFVQAINFVQEHQDMLKQVMAFIGDQRERVMDMLDNLPQLLAQTGRWMEYAGTSAKRAGAFLAGADGDPDSLSAQDIAEAVAKVLEHCQNEVRMAATTIDKVSDQVGDVRIPSIKPKYTEVMGLQLISGLQLKENELIENASERLKNGANRLEALSAQFDTFAEQIRMLGKTLTDTGLDIQKVGDQLAKSGGNLHALMSAPKVEAAGFMSDDAPNQSDGASRQLVLPFKFAADFAEANAPKPTVV
jgi:ABC-type transporter Mla subunit MlaD